MSDKPLEARFLKNLEDLGVGAEPTHFLVAFSGGLDSTVLLHLLRYRTPETITVTAAHFDHRMRAGSEEDAEWVRDRCRGWGVPLEVGVAQRRLAGESEAREARYTFLHQVLGRVRADLLATAHHADDQAETVLFRIVRGTGIEGLAGIPPRTRSGLIRPLLTFWRTELEAYAAANKLEWRTDPTNATVDPARNRIRLELLPQIERTIAPGARQNLVSLAGLARESESGWREVVQRAERDCIEQDRGATVLVRSKLAEYHPAVAKRIVRKTLRKRGIVLGASGTRSALQFITNGSSGRELHLPRGVRIRIEFDRARIEQASEQRASDETAVVDLPEAKRAHEARIRLGGRAYRVVLSRSDGRSDEAGADAIWRARVYLAFPRFPLLLRGRQPGDKVATAGGTKSLKKLMIERRIPSGERSCLPLLVDSEGTIIWAAQLGTFTDPAAPDDIALNLAVYDD